METQEPSNVPTDGNRYKRADAVPPVIYETIAYGISRSLNGNEIWVDFGNELGDVSFAKIQFRDAKTASDAYCKGIQLAIKVVEHPETEQ